MLAFGAHNDCGYLLSSNKSVATHVCLYFSIDRVSGDVNAETHDLLKEPNSFIDAKGIWEEHLGELNAHFVSLPKSY